MHTITTLKRTLPLVGGLALVAVLVALPVYWPAGAESPSLNAGRAESLRAAAPPEQQRALSDGSVTSDEYEQAVNATLGCVREGDVLATEPAWDGRNFRFTMGPYPSRAAMDLAGAVYQRCYEAHQREIDRAWAAQSSAGPRDQATVEGYYAAMAACVGASEPTYRAVVEAAGRSGDPGKLERCDAEVRATGVVD